MRPLCRKKKKKKGKRKKKRWGPSNSGIAEISPSFYSRTKRQVDRIKRGNMERKRRGKEKGPLDGYSLLSLLSEKAVKRKKKERRKEEKKEKRGAEGRHLEASIPISIYTEGQGF